jgi:hypothetical protein
MDGAAQREGFEQRRRQPEQLVREGVTYAGRQWDVDLVWVTGGSVRGGGVGGLVC